MEGFDEAGGVIDIFCGFHVSSSGWQPFHL